MPAATGAHTELWYKWELDASDNPDFGAGDGTEDVNRKPFGGNANTTALEISNNPLDVFEPNSREMAEIVAQHFDGSITIDFEITNPWWLQGVIAQATSEDNADGTYTHTFDGDVPLPMAIYAGYDEQATDGGTMYRIFEGVVNQTATVTTTVEGAAEISFAAIFANEETDETALEGQPTLDESVMMFQHATLQSEGSAISLVQDASVEINNNTDIIRELGTRLGVDYSPKGRIPSVDFTKIRENNDEVESFYGSEAASAVQETVTDQDEDLVYVLDNGESAGDGMNQMEIAMGGNFPESVSTENLGNPQEDLQQAIGRRLRTVTASATNEVEEAL